MPDVGIVSKSNSEAAAQPPRTVGECLNYRIKQARQVVEDLCVTKAKAEALGILDYPQEFIERVAYGQF